VSTVSRASGIPIRYVLLIHDDDDAEQPSWLPHHTLLTTVYSLHISCFHCLFLPQHQESIRVPLIIYDPRMPESKRNTLDDSLTLNIDLAETVLGAAGIKPHPAMQGRDMADLYLDPNRHGGGEETAAAKEPWRTEFYYDYRIPSGKGLFQSSALVRKDTKYMHWPEHNYESLYNLTADPLERQNLWGQPALQPVLEEMRERHAQLQKAAE